MFNEVRTAAAAATVSPLFLHIWADISVEGETLESQSGCTFPRGKLDRVPWKLDAVCLRDRLHQYFMNGSAVLHGVPIACMRYTRILVKVARDVEGAGLL